MSLADANSPEVVSRVHECMDLVDIVARQVRRQLGSRLDLDDMLSAGREGLLSAARSFDVSRGVPFRRWANLRVRGAVLDAVRQQGNLPRRVWQRLRAIEAGDRVQENAVEEEATAPAKSAQEADQRLGNYLAGIATAMAMGLIAEATGPEPEDVKDIRQSAEEQLAHHQLVALARAAVDRRPDAERHLLVRHYFEGVTFDEAAKELGLSKSWASRLHARAIEAMAKDLRRAR
jgi:RNA polymerase sigma factor for flagellar operon FliA